jgi:hypothetical protein
MLFALALAATQAGAQTKYTFTTFSVPNSQGTSVSAISDNGDVTGYYFLPAPPPSPPLSLTGFLRTASGTIATISYPGGTDTTPGGTNIIGTELNATLVGTGTDGTSLRCVLLETARPAYFSYLGQTSCTAPPCT